MKTPERNGYYWLIFDRLRANIVYVRGAKFYQPGRYFGYKIKKLREPHEWRGPLLIT